MYKSVTIKLPKDPEKEDVEKMPRSAQWLISLNLSEAKILLDRDENHKTDSINIWGRDLGVLHQLS